ncbi:MAG: DUF1905 domain-containing protein [Candidatus Paceibacteria bacterium]
MKKAKDLYKVKAVLGIYPSTRATWYVVTLPTKVGGKIYDKYKALQGGFGSLKVEVELGRSVWQTSIFRDRSAKSYILFIKASVRKKECIGEGDNITLTLSVL